MYILNKTCHCEGNTSRKSRKSCYLPPKQSGRLFCFKGYNRWVASSASLCLLATTCILILLTSQISYAHDVKSPYDSAYQKRIKFYPLYFNTLQLTTEQISEFEYIIEEYNNNYKENLSNKNILKELSKQEDKELKQILDKRQKAQFRIIKHLERQDIKRNLKEKDYYKSNPRMSVFGDIDKK